MRTFLTAEKGFMNGWKRIKIRINRNFNKIHTYMTNRAIKSHREIQLRLAKKLLGVLVAIILIFSLAFYSLSLVSEAYGLHGIYKEGVSADLCESIYFSIVTITTLGYGDFTPLGLSRLLAVFEALAGLFFAGYSIAQVLSVKQDASIDYIMKAQIIQNYTGLLENIRDAKESVTDSHRINRRSKEVNYINMNLYHAHPLYSSVIALQKLNGYTKHIEEIKMLDEIEDYLNRAATNIEELSSMVRKYANYMEAKDGDWRTSQSRKAIKEIIRCLENFLKYVQHTKYKDTNYKGHVRYEMVIDKTVSDLHRVLT